MGKNHRHKKDLKADKAKVKFKQTKTKFLPKGQNVTNTTFKIKPIVSAQHLKEKPEGIPLSQRKLDVKDLLRRIKHHTENVRISACEELSSIFKYHTEELMQNSFEIIPSISYLMLDREEKVRKAALKVVKTILELVPHEKLESDLNYFSIYMRCAMTNISRNIQEDSLLFLDCFLDHDCGLISRYADKLLPSFFILISKLRREAGLNRTVTVNLGNKVTSLSWKTKLLSKLHAVLETMYKNIVKCRNSDLKAPIIDARKCHFYPIYKESLRRALFDSASPYEDGSNNIEESYLAIENNLDALVSFLYESWIEVISDKKDNPVLNEEGAAVLSYIMKTLYLIWKCAELAGSTNSFAENIFSSSNEGKKFLNRLLMYFPYCQNEDVSKSKKRWNKSGRLSLDLNLDPNCVKENMMICLISYLVFNETHMNRNITIEMKAIQSYLNKCLLTQGYINEKNIQYLIEILKMCLVEKHVLWGKAGVNPRSLVESTIVFCNSIVLGEKYKIELFKILAHLVNIPFLGRLGKKPKIPLPEMKSPIGWPQYNAWLSSLPKLLCEPKITDDTVDLLLELSKKNNEVFHKALLKNLSEIFRNLDSVNLVVTKPSLKNTQHTMRRHIIYLFFYVPIFSREHEQEIKDYISRNPESYNSFFLGLLEKHCVE
ncbi:testis-expressed protein 10 homolog [Leptinotarsa decemlineata]|uniref:testis-expressed protein 10 homolog n=1 Tax=Leptinotarsa decemlineata TaxID=7539 RepID=UPI003D30BE4D